MATSNQKIRYDLEAAVSGEQDVAALARQLEGLADTLEGDLKTQAQESAKALRELGAKQGAVESFTKLKGEAGEAAAQLREAQEAAQKLGREMAASGAPTRAQAGQLEKLRDTVRTAKTELQSKTVALDQSRAALNRYGIGTSNLAQSERNLRAAIAGARSEVAQLVPTYTAAGKAVEVASSRTAGLSQQLTTLRNIAGAALGGTLVGSLAKDLADVADGYDNLSARIKLATGEGQAFESALSEVQRVALETNSDLDATGTLFARLADAGRSAGQSAQEAQADALGLTQTINEAIQVSGASSQAAQAAVTQLIQGLQTGELRGEEFNSVMEQSPRLAKAMADGLGVTIGQLRTMAQAGQLTATVVRDALRGQCSRLDVVALTNDQDGNGWGYLLNFADPLGRRKQWAMPSRMLAGDGSEYRGALMGMGLRIATSPRARNLLTQYIQTRQPGEFATCTDRIGWHGLAFVLPHETVGDEADRVVFQSESAQENTFRVKGSAAQWRDRVSLACAGNTRLVFAVSAAFAGPLLKPAGMEGGGFHMRGDGSTGKSTTQVVAASVYGNPERFKQSWKATDNALEGVAAQHNDCLLILDEIGEVDPKVVGECAYMLGNGQGKARAARTGVPRPRLSWRLLFLSSGEKSLADHMQEVGKRTRAGQETRMADIPADAGKGMGAFEDVHGHEGGAAFSRHLVAQASACHGAAGRAWLLWLTENAEGLRDRIRTLAQRIELQIVPELGSGQVQRVGARFALVGAAGELATEAGLTGWHKGEAEQAARECFNAWLVARGGIGNSEETMMVRQVRHFLEANGDGRFMTWHRAHDDHAPRVGLRAGVRRLIGSNGLPIGVRKLPEFAHEISDPEGESVEFFIFPEVFKSEICKGYDPEAVARVLRDRECLQAKEPGRFTVSMSLPGGIGKARVYHVSARIFALDT